MKRLYNVKAVLGIMLMAIISFCVAEPVWEPEIPISPVDAIESILSRSQQRSIAVGQDGRIHVVWHENNSPDPDVYWGIWYTYSDDNGNTWAPPIFISTPIHYGEEILNYTNMDPSIAILEPGQINVAWDGFSNPPWTDGFAFYGRSFDNGQTWSIHRWWQYWDSEQSGWNSICSDRDNYLMFYDEQFVPQFMETRLLNLYSTNRGENWTSGAWHGWLNLKKPDNSPCTACDSSDAGYVVWEAVDTLNHQVIMFGTVAGVEKELVPYPGTGGRADPFIESNFNGKLYAVWYDGRNGNNEIYFKKSTDCGSTWSADTRLTNSAASSTQPVIVLGGSGKIYLVWMEGGTVANVYFKYSQDDGLSWSTDTRLTNGSMMRTSPHIAISPNNLNLYVIWNDNRDGQREVYFKRGTITVGVEEELTKENETQWGLSICPNPFRERTHLKLQIPIRHDPPNRMGDWQTDHQEDSQSQLSLKIYDATGRLVKNLLQPSVRCLLSTQVSWDGTNDAGHKVPAGVYFVQLETSGYHETAKITLTR